MVWNGVEWRVLTGGRRRGCHLSQMLVRGLLRIITSGSGAGERSAPEGRAAASCPVAASGPLLPRYGRGDMPGVAAPGSLVCSRCRRRCRQEQEWCRRMRRCPAPRPLRGEIPRRHFLKAPRRRRRCRCRCFLPALWPESLLWPDSPQTHLVSFSVFSYFIYGGFMLCRIA